MLVSPGRGTRGFTMVELIVVMVTLSVLAALTVPTFQTLKKGTAARVVAASAQSVVSEANSLMALDHTTDPATADQYLEAAIADLHLGSQYAWDADANTLTGTIDGVTQMVTFTFVNGSWVLSDPVEGDAPAAAANVDPPFNLVVTGALGADLSVNLSWPAPNPAVDGFHVYEGAVLIATLGASATGTPVTGLTAGQEYTFTVRPFNSVGEPAEVATGESVTLVPVDIPPAPGSFTVLPDPDSSSSLDFNWDQVTSTSSTPVTGYRLFLLNQDSTISEMIYQGPATSFVKASLTPGQGYSFKVAAYGSGGQGALSQAAAATPVSRPGNVTPSVSYPSAGTARLSWSLPPVDLSAPVSGFRVYKDNVLAATLAASVVNYDYTGLIDGVSYTLMVRPFNFLGEPATQGGSLVTESNIAPNPPTGLTVTVLATSSTSMDIAWNAVTSTALAPVSGYRVFKLNTSNGLYEQAVQTSALSTTITSLTAGTSYSFKVAAYGSGGQSVLSDPVSATPVSAPSPVANLVATRSGYGSITLNWDMPAADAAAPVTGVNVYFSAENLYASMGNATSTTITNLINGSVYTFNVSTTNIRGESTLTSVTAVPYAVPAAPTGFTAAPHSGVAAANYLSWNTPTGTSDTPVSGVRVYRLNPSSGLYEQAAQVALGNSNYTDSSLTPGTVYSYKLAAYGSGGQGVFTSPISVTAVTTPAPATDVVATSLTGGGLSLTWTLPSQSPGAAPTAVKVYKNGSLSQTLSAGATSTTIPSGFSVGVSYTMGIFLANGSPDAVTNLVFTYAGPPSVAPTGISVNVTSGADASLTLNWSAVTPTGNSPVSGYRVLRLNPSTGLYEQIAQTSGLTYIDSSLTAGTLYSYKLAAYGSGGQGVQSSIYGGTAINRPAAVTLNTPAANGNGSALISWASVSTTAAPVTSYKVYKDGVLYTTTGGLSVTASGLTAGVTYSFNVVSSNASGDRVTPGPDETQSYTAVGAPTSAPLGFTLGQTPNTDNSLTASWSAVTGTSANPVTGYHVYQDTGFWGNCYWDGEGDVCDWIASWTLAASTTGTSVSFTPPGDLGANQSYALTAYNSAGDGITTGVYTSTSAHARSKPSSPVTNLAYSTPSKQTVTLTWGNPPATTLTAIDGFHVYKDGVLTATAPIWPTNSTVSGLTGGQSYIFTVRAYNEAGDALSASGDSVTVTATSFNPPSVTGWVTVYSLSGGLTVNWTAPASESPVTDYHVRYCPSNLVMFGSCNNGSGWVVLNDGVSTTTTATITGLTNGTAYQVSVEAVSAGGLSGYGGTNTGTPSTASPPSAPTFTSVSPHPSAYGSLYLNWTAPVSNGGATINTYETQYSTDAGASWSTPVSSNSSAPGYGWYSYPAGAYLFRVRAVSTAGPGPWSGSYAQGIAATPLATPEAPVLVTAGGTGTMTATWSPPAGVNGASVTYFPQYSINGGASWTSAPSTFSTTYTTPALLFNTMCTFRVRAYVGPGTNGTSADSASSNSILVGAPGPVGSVTVNNPQTAALGLSWSAPLTNYTLYDYLVQYRTSPAGAWATFNDGVSTVTSTTITGLTVGTLYDVRVAAVNWSGTYYGYGSYSTVYSGTPQTITGTLPSAPTNVVGSYTGCTSCSNNPLTWSPPSNTGGLPITGYKVYTRYTNSVGPGTLLRTVSGSTFVTYVYSDESDSYYYYVVAVNSLGDGPDSPTVGI